MSIDAASLDPTRFASYFDTPRHALIDLLDQAGGTSPRRVLELGCGCGANLAEIRRRHPQAHTVGVERQPEAAATARSRAGVDELLQADLLDTTRVAFEAGSFDLVVLSHVLEHFAEPEALLARCHRWLVPGGRALIALPNLRHVTVIKQLLVDGDFRYRDDGILDRTHLRFYTRASAERMLRAQGYEVTARRGDVAGRKSRLLDLASLGLAREFTAFAYNFLAVRP